MRLKQKWLSHCCNNKCFRFRLTIFIYNIRLLYFTEKFQVFLQVYFDHRCAIFKHYLQWLGINSRIEQKHQYQSLYSHIFQYKCKQIALNNGDAGKFMRRSSLDILLSLGWLCQPKLSPGRGNLEPLDNTRIQLL